MDKNQNQESIYIIKISGHLKEKWAEWLNGVVVKIDNLANENVTAITVRIPDQAALRGVLNKLWDLNLILLAVVLKDVSIVGEKNET
jgi:hypothetical protein